VTPGEPANPANPPSGCPFHPRCVKVMDICKSVDPALIDSRDPAGGRRGHLIACHLYHSMPREDGQSNALTPKPEKRGLWGKQA